jgi:hypothetical protein
MSNIEPSFEKGDIVVHKSELHCLEVGRHHMVVVGPYDNAKVTVPSPGPAILCTWIEVVGGELKRQDRPFYWFELKKVG